MQSRVSSPLASPCHAPTLPWNVTSTLHRDAHTLTMTWYWSRSLIAQRTAADSREVLEEGGVAADVLDRLFSSTLARIASDGAAEDTLLDRLMQRELELLNSIWDGSGLADHLEDVYLEVLEAAAQKSAVEPGSLKSALDTLGDELEANEPVSV